MGSLYHTEAVKLVRKFFGSLRALVGKWAGGLQRPACPQPHPTVLRDQQVVAQHGGVFSKW